MMKYLLLSSLGPEKLPTLKELTTNEICRVWAAASRYIRRQLAQKKTVEIGIGRFGVVPAHATVGEDEVLPLQRPVFQLSRLMKKFYKLKCAKAKIPEGTPSVELDFEQIAADIHFRPEIVEQCVHETLLFFSGALRDRKEVEFTFRSIGILAVRRGVVSMTFFDDCLLELDATGNMLAALHGDSNMRRIVAFPGKHQLARLSQAGVVTLPRLALETPKQESILAVSMKPRRESAPWGGGARRVSVLDPVFLAQRRVSLARQLAWEDLQARPKEGTRARFLLTIGQKSQEELKHPRADACPRGHLPACVPQSSGVGTSSPNTKRAEKRLQLLMASRRREVEEEVWHRYLAHRMGPGTERGWMSCPYVYEDPYCPPHLRRKAYAEKLKERREREPCQRPAGPRASEGQAELRLPGLAQEDTEEPRRLMEVRGKALGRPAMPGSSRQPRREQPQGP